MAPILGIYASQISGHLFAPSGAYDSIATVTVGSGGSASITFSSIPSTYTHLQIRATFRETGSGTGADTKLSFNGDTGSGNYYSQHGLYGNGTIAGADKDATSTHIWSIYGTGSSATSGVFGVGVIDVLDYANTNKYKTTRALTGYDNNGSGLIFLRSGLWMKTNAITSITITADATAFAEYSSFALYGIKG